MASYLHHHIPGVKVPRIIRDRFEKAREDDYEELGIEISLEIIDALKGKKGIKGIHLMSVGWEAVVPRILKDAGLVHKSL